MLKNLIKNDSVIHIAKREYRVRYSLNALLCLEMTYKPLNEILQTQYSDWSIEDVLQLLRAAMCDLPQNFKAVNQRRFDRIKPSLSELGEKIQPADLPMLKFEIIQAVISSMPDTEQKHETPSKAMNEGHLRAVYVDEMKRPESEFWRSNHKEITERINYYLEAKGLKETAELVQEFED